MVNTRAGTGQQQEQVAGPFLKWAGGKSQLLKKFEGLFPEDIKTGSVRNYVEPFVGGGAVYFFVNQRYRIGRCHIFDKNEELVLAYSVVKKDVESLIREITRISEEYVASDPAARQHMFYRIREDFNELHRDVDFSRYNRTWKERAAQLIFLNRTCYNGLFRVNSDGEFNVPFGRYRQPKILDAEKLRAASATLANTSIHRGDFTACARYAPAGSFVYLDPPYRPRSRSSSFTSYASGGFREGDQVRLARFARTLDHKGVKFMISNSDTGDGFFEGIYDGFTLEKVLARRAINSKGAKRGEITELIITNYR
ncbi:MAG: DNA adenine methylase [Methanoregulaceae archaeon]|nr:DNA adenine methylase [Methanoregulaceae archaeon]